MTMHPQPNADRFAKALKLSQLDPLAWHGDTITVRMPDRNVNLTITRDANRYRIAIAATANARPDLLTSVGECLNGYIEKHGTEGGWLDEPHLRELFGKLQQQYRTLHKPVSLKLPPVRDAALAPIIDGDTSYSYAQVMRAMHGNERLSWQPRHSYGNECIRLSMPDATSDLIISRRHTHQGAVHAVFPVGNDPLTVDYVNRFTERHAIKIETMGGFTAADIRDLIYGLRRLPINLTAEPLPTAGKPR